MTKNSPSFYFFFFFGSSYYTTSTLCGMIQLLYVHALLYRLDFLFLFLFLLLVASCWYHTVLLDRFRVDDLDDDFVMHALEQHLPFVRQPLVLLPAHEDAHQRVWYVLVCNKQRPELDAFETRLCIVVPDLHNDRNEFVDFLFNPDNNYTDKSRVFRARRGRRGEGGWSSTYC